MNLGNRDEAVAAPTASVSALPEATDTSIPGLTPMPPAGAPAPAPPKGNAVSRSFAAVGADFEHLFSGLGSLFHRKKGARTASPAPAGSGAKPVSATDSDAAYLSGHGQVSAAGRRLRSAPRQSGARHRRG